MPEIVPKVWPGSNFAGRGIDDNDQRKVDVTERLRNVAQRPLQDYRDDQCNCIACTPSILLKNDISAARSPCLWLPNGVWRFLLEFRSLRRFVKQNADLLH